MPGCEPFAYKTASGRARWLNGDPVGEHGGINLLAAFENDGVNSIDPLGAISVDIKSTPDGNPGYWHTVTHKNLPIEKGSNIVQVVKTTHFLKFIGEKLQQIGPGFKVDTWKAVRNQINDNYWTIIPIPTSKQLKVCFLRSVDESSVGVITDEQVGTLGIKDASSMEVDATVASSIIGTQRSKYAFEVFNILWLDQSMQRQEKVYQRTP
jgi:hypothetical protein